ncbi:MAG: sigma-70 family RNA polymerase sigma factor [Candidatus Aminicenantes bacterium]|nr:sigma-70 family RNA polymerase sigma factor [Candidatus Aminicenantes bacterium]
MNDEPKGPHMNDHMNIIMAKDGNPEAFSQLYREHGERIFRIAYRYTRSQSDAEDILQETFIKAFKNIHTLRVNPKNRFSSWLNTICINYTLDHLRKQRRKKRHSQVSLSDVLQVIQSSDHSPVDKMESKQVGQHIHNALSSLSPKQHLIFEMRYSQHMDIKNIAQTLQCSQSNVKTHISRALKKLRKTLEPIWRKP